MSNSRTHVLDALVPIKEGDCVMAKFLPTNRWIYGRVIDRIGNTCTLTTAKGERFTIEREHITKKVDRIKLPGLSEVLYEHSLSDPDHAKEICQDLLDSLEWIMTHGSDEQKGLAKRLMVAVNFSASEIN